MMRLASMTGLVAVGAVAFAVLGDEVEAQYTDPGILTYITLVYTLGVAVMLIYTRRWNTIGCGLLATMTGDALLYAKASDILPYPPGSWPLDLARSCFAVGGTYLALGILLWARDHWRERRALELTVPDGGE